MTSMIGRRVYRIVYRTLYRIVNHQEISGNPYTGSFTERHPPPVAPPAAADPIRRAAIIGGHPESAHRQPRY